MNAKRRAEWNRNRRKKLREDGKCSVCWQDKEQEDKSMCNKCLKDAREATAYRRKFARENGLCVECKNKDKKAEEGYTRCLDCLKKGRKPGPIKRRGFMALARAKRASNE